METLIKKYGVMIFILLCGLISPVLGRAAKTVQNPKAVPTDSLSAQPYSELTSAQNYFGFNFFKEILKENPGQNLLVSPFSASTALGMVYDGAVGTTKTAMANVLGLGSMKRYEVNIENYSLQQALQNADPDVKLNIANSLWANQNIHFKSEFLRENQTGYQAEVTNLDFSLPGASDKINQWVSEKTMGKIPTIVGPLTPRDALVLVNAVYFKGIWASKFKKEMTRTGSFHEADGSSQDCLMMHQTQSYSYLVTATFQAVRLPYGDGRLSLVVFLPALNSSLAEFCGRLTTDDWGEWMSQFSFKQVVLSLPKFKIKFTTGLNQSLTLLGMGVAFDKNQANFSGVASLSPSITNLYISQAIQKTYMSVDEEGTEAVAATAIRIHDAMAIEAIPRVVMTVDRPFFIALEDQQTKTILFAGAILDPRMK